MRTTFMLALLLAFCTDLAAAAEPERAEWWSIDKEVAEELLTRDAGAWARELNREPATTAGELMRHFSLFNRAGHLRQAERVIDAMSDAKIENSQFSAMADFLIDRKDWPTARYFLERLPQSTPGWGYVLIKEWASTADAKQIDAWLVERGKANPHYWLPERLRFRHDRGTAGELIEELASEVRRRPRDVEVALKFLEATAIIGHSERDIAWLGDVCRPPSAYASYRLGKALRAAPRAAIKLLEHSLEMPFTEQDAATLRAEMARRPSALARPAPQPPLEKQVRYSTKRELLTALHAVGESARAQKLLEELAALEANGLPPGGLDAMAGQIQAASGARVVQQRFQNAEAENEESAEYWQRRARYYTGRKEHDEAIAAYEKALQLALPDDDQNAARARGAVPRSSVLSNYVSFLEHSDREASAARLLERELRDAPPGGIYAQRIVSNVAGGGRSKPFRIDQERLWAYLAARPEWDHQEERLLWRLVEQPTDQPQKRWERAEGLARDAHPSRSQVLGWVMTRSDATDRAIAWLKSALQRLEKPEERQRAAFNLFDAYLDVGDWRSAEEIWPTARERLTPKELPDWLGRIAVAAARAGEQSEALRLWKQRTNLDRAATVHLDEMLGAGLREPLLAFYRSLAEQDPDCQSIEPVIKQIQASKADTR
jgi:tetratricopeptide (TPR) repeat protein